jgi:hypothetical protein
MPETPLEWVGMIGVIGLLALMGCAGAILLFLVVRDTCRRRGRWGINLQGLGGADCPRCGESQPAVRVPRSLNQALWGGWTCPGCDSEIDKWGREVPGESDQQQSKPDARERRGKVE